MLCSAAGSLKQLTSLRILGSVCKGRNWAVEGIQLQGSASFLVPKAWIRMHT